MSTVTITIVTRYKVELEDLKRDQRQITENYEPAILPSFLGDDNVEFLDGSITYDN